MCGIVAIVTTRPATLENDICAMNDALVHRGPDDSGMTVSYEDGIAIAMRRLSIVDIAGGHQPIWSESRNHAVVFNGEIYNARQLRARLVEKGHRFQTDHSDTEVLVHGYEEWGSELLPQLNGMFAFILWDRSQARLMLARDFTGEKPLYVARFDGGYAVASEIKALLKHPRISREIDAEGLEQFLNFDFAIAPRTIFADIKKLPAGHYAYLTSSSFSSQRYWSPSFAPLRDRMTSERHLLDRFDTILTESVRARMLADVPIGLFLSGGLDSSSVGYYMKREVSEVESFSIGFDSDKHDETHFARKVANHLGTRHHVEMFSENRVRDLLSNVAGILDEPMADQSILPTYLLCATARKLVKVAIGGDGADEILMGYRTYRMLRGHDKFDSFPSLLRTPTLNLATALFKRRPFARPSRVVRAATLSRTARVLCYRGAYAGEATLVLSRELRTRLGANAFDEPAARLLDGSTTHTAADESINAYVRGYLQEDILVKVDRASMAVSLEVRSPFLDPEVIDFLGRVPESLKLRGLTGKYLLRQLMQNRLPAEILHRKKHGFDVPLGDWFRGPLRDLLGDYLDPVRLQTQGIFDPAPISQMLADHTSGRRDNARQLWPVLLFQLWHDRWLGSSI